MRKSLCRTESQLTGMQCTSQGAWNDLMFNWFRHEIFVPVIHHPEFLSVLPLGARVGCCLGLGSLAQASA